MSTADRHLLICRPGFEVALGDELQARGAQPSTVGAGLVATDRAPDGLLFARQLLPRAGFVAREHLKPLSDATLVALCSSLLASPTRWTSHAFALDDALRSRATGIEGVVLRQVARRHPELDRLYRPPHRAEKMEDALVLQLCLDERGLWHSTAAQCELLSRQPAGVVRMKDDPDAPSRSYLKIEEAFSVLNVWPSPGQTVVDLGAAPGGWTWAFLKRGCHVTAVDNGPLKLNTNPQPPATRPGSVRHLRADGLAYTPEQPVDWLVADMLIPPGAALGLLKRWIGARWMRRFAVNIKLPQERPYAALEPVIALLRFQVSGFRCQIRQLYHDRREVTALGQIT